MKRLFNNERYTQEAHDLHFTTIGNIRRAFKDYIKYGYNIRDIEYVMQKAITDIALEYLLQLPDDGIIWKIKQ